MIFHRNHGNVQSLLLAVVFALTTTHAVGESKTLTATNTESTSLEIGDPINAGTGEFFFRKNLINLGGPLPVRFGVIYGSQQSYKAYPDGLPDRFAGNHRGTIVRIDATETTELFVDTGFGKEIGFNDSGYEWTPFAMESTQYAIKETPDYYYLRDPVRNLLYTYKKTASTFEYRTCELISVSTAGVQGDNNCSKLGISGDGRYVVFDSYASNLVDNDTNGVSDIFLRDRKTDVTTRINLGSGGVEANGNSYRPVISRDGHYVSYDSLATNLTSDATDGKRSVFRYDMETGTTTLISQGLNDTAANGHSYSYSISADGRYVGFSSSSSNIVADDTNGVSDCFVRDMVDGGTVRVSVKSDGAQGDALSTRPIISGDGSVVAFESEATNFAANDTNGKRDVFLWRRSSQALSRLSESTEGTPGNDTSLNAAVSNDGRYVVFESAATNLIADDTNGARDIFLRDTQLNTTTRVSLDASGGQFASDSSQTPAISDDGSTVVYRVGYACFLYLHNLKTNKICVISKTKDGEDPNEQSHRPQLTSDATQVAFLSEASNLLPNDTNGKDDVFITRLHSSDKAFLTRVEDRNGNAITYETTDEANVEKRGPDRVYDGKGRELKFTYAVVGTTDTSPYLTKVEDQTGRAYTFAYEENPTDNAGEVTLRSITDPLGNATTFTYGGSSLITKTTQPMGNTPFERTYEVVIGGGVVKTQTDAYGNVTTLTKDQFPADATSHETKFTVTNPDATTETYVNDHDGRVAKSLKDAAGKTATIASDATKDEFTGVTDRMGGVTSFATHAASGQFAGLTDAEGGTFATTFTATSQTFTNPVNSEQVSFDFYDPTKVAYPDGTSAQFTYDGSGDMLTHVNRAGKTWTFTYDSQGLPLTFTNPTGGVATRVYNSDGTLATVKDSETGVFQYAYDTLKRLTKITRPDETTRSLAYDDNDRVTSITDEAGKTTTYEYDKNGRLVKVTNPEGNSRAFTYNLMDQLSTATDFSGKTSSYEYDKRNRLATSTNPDNVTTTYGYDADGRIDKATLGTSSWTITYDDEGAPTAYAKPSGATVTAANNKLGWATSLTNADAKKTEFVRDAMQRVTKETDPLEQATTYSYDSLGKLASVDKPEIGSAAYKRDDLGLLEEITDLNGKKWTFGHSQIGRPTSLKDPLGNTVTQAYDTMGRPSVTTFADETTLTLTYDARGNVTTKAYSGGLTLNYSYDANTGRLTAADKIGFSHDASGRLIGVGSTTLEYNGLNDVISRKEGDEGTTYYYNYAIGLHPIVAERNIADAAWLRYYVYTPSGKLLYMIDAADSNKVHFYHTDHLGSVLFMTDAAGTVTNSYAYAPDGTLLKHDGDSAQPFTFVGTLGVRQEGTSGTFYQMRARYYDAVTGQFISREPIWPRIRQPEALNPYQYALNNPTKYVDVTGLDSWKADFQNSIMFMTKSELKREETRLRKDLWDTRDVSENGLGEFVAFWALVFAGIAEVDGISSNDQVMYDSVKELKESLKHGALSLHEVELMQKQKMVQKLLAKFEEAETPTGPKRTTLFYMDPAVTPPPPETPPGPKRTTLFYMDPAVTPPPPGTQPPPPQRTTLFYMDPAVSSTPSLFGDEDLLGLGDGDQSWYGYAYGLTGFDIADSSTWSLENYTCISAK